MQNWIGIAIWIVLGAVIGLVMKALIARPEETPGHTPVLVVLGAFAAHKSEVTEGFMALAGAGR